MKAYIAPHQLRLVGKGWEIRHYLKTALKNSSSPAKLLSDWLPAACPSRETRGVVVPFRAHSR